MVVVGGSIPLALPNILTKPSHDGFFVCYFNKLLEFTICGVLMHSIDCQASMGATLGASQPS